MDDAYPDFHLCRLDFPLDNLESLPTYKLALVVFHPHAAEEHRSRAELLWGRARERDRAAGEAVGVNEARAIRAELALQREEQSATQGDDDDDTSLVRLGERIAQAQSSIAATEARFIQLLNRRAAGQAVSVPASRPGAALAREASPVFPAEAADRSEPTPSTSAQGIVPPPPPPPATNPPAPILSFSRSGFIPTFPPTITLHSPPTAMPLPTDPVPAELLDRLFFVQILIPFTHTTPKLLRHFLLRTNAGASKYGPMPIILARVNSHAFADTPSEPEQAVFCVGYRTVKEANRSVQRNHGRTLPLSPASPSKEFRLSARTTPKPPFDLLWSSVWPPAQRDWLAYQQVTEFVGDPPTHTKQTGSKEYLEEMQLVKALGGWMEGLPGGKAAAKADKQAKQAAKKQAARKQAQVKAAPKPKAGNKLKTASKKAKSFLPHPPPHPLPLPSSSNIAYQSIDYSHEQYSAPSWDQPPQPHHSYQQSSRPFSNIQSYTSHASIPHQQQQQAWRGFREGFDGGSGGEYHRGEQLEDSRWY